MKKPREGSLLRICLGDGNSAFARVLANSQVAIYSYRAQQEDLPLEEIYASIILWKLTAMKSALTSGRWPIVAFRPLEPELCLPVEYFMKDIFTEKFSVYRSSDGNIRTSTFEECKTLEKAAVWEASHIVDRLCDHFAGRPNVWTEQLKPTL